MRALPTERSMIVRAFLISTDGGQQLHRMILASKLVEHTRPITIYGLISLPFAHLVAHQSRDIDTVGQFCICCLCQTRHGY